MSFAMVFPGQGSQSVGMFDAYGASNEVLETVRSASEILHQDVARLVRDGPAEELSRTTNTQPLMVIAGMVAFRCWQAQGGPLPTFVAGHSLGEYTALVAAGVLAFADALPLVRFRAQAMQEAVPMGTGAMAAILGLDDDAVRAACAEVAQGEIVEPVNFNAPNQVVIAGHKAAVERGAEAAKARGAKRAIMLPVSAPFHSSLLKPAADRLQERMQSVTFRVPQIAIINNVDVAMVNDPAQIKDALARQACNPVRWVETVRAFAAQGVTHVVECGPGKVLAGLTKRIEGSLQGYAVTDPASLQQTMEALQ